MDTLNKLDKHTELTFKVLGSILYCKYCEFQTDIPSYFLNHLWIHGGVPRVGVFWFFSKHAKIDFLKEEI